MLMLTFGDLYTNDQKGVFGVNESDHKETGVHYRY